MAHSKLYFEQPNTGMRRTAPVGFSWTSFFWGFIPCVFRQDWLAAVTIFAVSVATAVVGGNFIVWILQGFFYNKWYVQKLVEQGYVVTGHEGRPFEEIERTLDMRLPVKTLNG